MWQKDQIAQLGQQIRKRELRLRDVSYQNEKLSKQLANMRTVGYLEARIRDLNLGLVRPEQAQVWRLPEPSREAPRAEREPQYAAREATLP